MMTKWICLAFVLFVVSAQQHNEQKLQYTEDLATFKADKYKVRMEMLVGCWLVTREYLPLANQRQKLVFIKICLKHITRKDSVVKITSLIGKNMTATKNYEQIVPASEIPVLSSISETQTTQFDTFLLGMLDNYQKDLIKVQGQEGKQLKKMVQEEVEKRHKKYYFGIIPANQWTHLLMLAIISVIMTIVYKCWKMYGSSNHQTHRQHKHDYFKHSSSFTKEANGSSKKNQ